MAGRLFRIRNLSWWSLEPGGVVDYWAKVNLAREVSIRKTTKDAIVFFEAALAEVEVLLGISWVEDLADPDTGQIGTLRIVTDDGSCFKSARSASRVASKRHIVHIRTRNKTPWTNGMIERSFGAIKYEHLYRREIGDGLTLAAEVDTYWTIYNTIRPHEAITMTPPLDRYQQAKTKPSRHENCLRFLTRDKIGNQTEWSPSDPGQFRGRLLSCAGQFR
ncbi:MAG: integrase core domain-containing protein [Acidimicrobiia bacterium]